MGRHFDNTRDFRPVRGDDSGRADPGGAQAHDAHDGHAAATAGPGRHDPGPGHHDNPGRSDSPGRSHDPARTFGPGHGPGDPQALRGLIARSTPVVGPAV
jgi:hypothetical protein